MDSRWICKRQYGTAVSMHEEWQESFALCCNLTYCSSFTPAPEQNDNTIGQPNWLRLTPASSIGFGLLWLVW